MPYTLPLDHTKEEQTISLEFCAMLNQRPEKVSLQQQKEMEEDPTSQDRCILV
jgi:hypothetical protein